jgi:hypothetical protein
MANLISLDNPLPVQRFTLASRNGDQSRLGNTTSKSGSLTMLTANRRASSRVSKMYVLFWTATAHSEKLAWLPVEKIKPNRVCLCCGKAVHVARSVPALGALPELHTYDCYACGVAFTEAVGSGERHEIKSIR